MDKQQLRVIILLSITLFALPIASRGGTYSGALDTANVLKEGHGRASFEFFSAFNAGGQVNPLLHVQYGLIPNLDLNAFIGTGSVEFQSGLGGQYLILPDAAGQVGVSISTNIRYLLSGTSGFLWESYPTVSKAFKEWNVLWTPYGSFQYALEARSRYTTSRLSLVIGSEIKPVQFNALSFFTEFGFNLYRSSWSFALQASITIDKLAKWDSVELP